MRTLRILVILALCIGASVWAGLTDEPLSRLGGILWPLVAAVFAIGEYGARRRAELLEEVVKTITAEIKELKGWLETLRRRLEGLYGGQEGV